VPVRAGRVVDVWGAGCSDRGLGRGLRRPRGEQRWGALCWLWWLAAAVRVFTAPIGITTLDIVDRPLHRNAHSSGAVRGLGRARPVSVLTGVLHALGGAAAAWTRAASSPVATGRVGALSGIDYLARLRDGYQRELLRDLGIADPGHSAASAAWDSQ
jgi:hypothetical protein